MSRSDRGGRQPAAGSMRLFIAVLLPEFWLTLLSDVQQRLRADGLDLRYVWPEGIHLTVRFLGETPVSRVSAIERALAEAVTEAAAFELRLGRPGTFGPPRRPRVLWVGVDGDRTQLTALYAAVEGALKEIGIAPEGRGFNPHLTLARVPEGIAADQGSAIGPAIGRLPAMTAEACRVDSIALMRSELGPGGARYTALNTWRLGG